jgi:hypothetical protein
VWAPKLADVSQIALELAGRRPEQIAITAMIEHTVA